MFYFIASSATLSKTFSIRQTKIKLLWIRIRMFLDHLDPDPSLFVRILIRNWIRILPHHQATIVRKTLVSNVLWLFYDILSLKTDVNIPSKRKKQKNFRKKNIFVALLQVTHEKSRIRIRKSVVRIRIQSRTKISRIHNTEIKKSSINISNNAPPCSIGLTLLMKVVSTK